MRRLHTLVGMLAMLLLFQSCQPATTIYDAKADAEAQLDSALLVAREAHKTVLVQVGGDWCPWCVRLHKFIEADPELRESLTSDYVFLRVYYGKENKNEAAMARLGNPTDLGFPAFVVLSPRGEVLHKQSTDVLESGDSYDRDKIADFLAKWVVHARVPELPIEENGQTASDTLAGEVVE